LGWNAFLSLRVREKRRATGRAVSIALQCAPPPPIKRAKGACPTMDMAARSRSRGKKMRAFSVSADENLAITASLTSSKNDFDYLLGRWTIKNRTLKEQLTGSGEWEEFDATQECRPILLGLGNFDIFHTELGGKPFEGLTVRLFDPKTRLWTIYWADSEAMKLDGGKVGSFDGEEGEFFGREVVDGKDVIVKFHWDKRNPRTPIYSRAFSADGGRTWEWNWYSIFSQALID
jgi:hypothetical protein